MYLYLIFILIFNVHQLINYLFVVREDNFLGTTKTQNIEILWTQYDIISWEHVTRLQKTAMKSFKRYY